METKILYSPGFGAGFYTWNETYPEVIKDEFIISLIEEKGLDKAYKQIVKYLDKKYNGEFYTRGVENLRICKLEKGTKFSIEEYDGSEYIITDKDLIFTA